MKRKCFALLACACAAFEASTCALAADPLGFYVGGAVGRSSIRDDRVVFTSPFVDPQTHQRDEHHTAWKVMFGLRPIPILGAELEYLDLAIQI